MKFKNVKIMRSSRQTMTMIMVALLATACSQNEITEVNPDSHRAVSFDTYTGVSRGTDVTNTTMQGACDDTHYGGFGIMAYYTGTTSWNDMVKDHLSELKPTFMFNQKVTYDKTAWIYSPVKYWPNNKNDKVSFFAYAPYESDKNGDRVGIVTSQITDTGTPKITFTLKPTDKLDKMVDLVVATAKDKSQTNDAISFDFGHILSKIAFKAKLGADYSGLDGTNSFVYITHMWIVGSTQTNSQSVLTPGLEANAGSKFYTQATWKDLKWDYNGAVIAEKDYSLNSLMKMESDQITEIWDGSTASGQTGEQSVSGIKLHKDAGEVDLFKDGHFLYLIPVGEISETPDSNPGCKKGEVQIGFHYDIVTRTTDSTPDSPKYLVSHIESKVSLPEGHMKRNTQYTYTFTINLKEIRVTAAEVAPWGTDTGTFPMQ